MSDRGSWTLSDANADMLCEAETQQSSYLKDLLQLARVLLCVHSHAVTAVAGRYVERVLRHPGANLLTAGACQEQAYGVTRGTGHLSKLTWTEQHMQDMPKCRGHRWPSVQVPDAVESCLMHLIHVGALRFAARKLPLGNGGSQCSQAGPPL